MRKNVAVIFGGISCENEISVITGTMAANLIDPEKYAVLSERLNKETLLYRYIDLQWYYGYYTKQQQSDMIDAFEADCAAYGVTSYREGYSVQIRINEFRSRI